MTTEILKLKGIKYLLSVIRLRRIDLTCSDFQTSSCIGRMWRPSGISGNGSGVCMVLYQVYAKGKFHSRVSSSIVARLVRDFTVHSSIWLIWSYATLVNDSYLNVVRHCTKQNTLWLMWSYEGFISGCFETWQQDILRPLQGIITWRITTQSNLVDIRTSLIWPGHLLEVTIS